jgi:two-component system NtrC family sensor kinase
VAHEINNPLSILSGYAELSMKRLRRVPADSVDAEVVKHLAIIRGEAFRCKEITQKLLSLSRGNSDVREIVSLADAINEVAKLVSGLKIFQSRKLEIKLSGEERLFIQANLTEMKQVLLNLVINAMEAVPEGAGVVVVEGRRTPDRVEVCVSDNGQGMSEETMGRIFEPFFTTKRGAAEPGTGLGLSITHAIVTHHGGVIEVRSDGVNKGSRFTIRFPHAGAMETPAEYSRANPAGKPVPAPASQPIAEPVA